MATFPPGWTINEVIEVLPTLNPPPMTGPFFSRRTYICTNEFGQNICSSGAREDCEAQAQALAESRTQKQPYNQAI